MDYCELHIPELVFKYDFTIIYKGSLDGKDELGEIKTSKEELMRKLRYFKDKTEIKQQNELFIHDKYPLNIFSDFISSIKTNIIKIDTNNCNYYYDLSSKYQYYELQEEVSKYMQERPDLQKLINQLSNEKNIQEIEINSIIEKEEIISQNLDVCIQLGLLNQLPINRLIQILNTPKRILKNHSLLLEFIKGKINQNKKSNEYNTEQIQMLVNSLDLNKISIDEMDDLINNFKINFFF